MPVMYLSPSLTPRNPTPHEPAVRLYELQPGGAASGGARLGDAVDHTLLLDESNRRGRPVWSETSLRAAHGLSSLSHAEWSRWLGRLEVDDAAFGAAMGAQRCADEIEPDYARCKAGAVCGVLADGAHARRGAEGLAPRDEAAAVRVSDRARRAPAHLTFLNHPQRSLIFAQPFLEISGERCLERCRPEPTDERIRD
jgi:hypothetical protein